MQPHRLARSTATLVALAATILSACSAAARSPGGGSEGGPASRAAEPSSSPAYDVVIRDARVLDGTGSPWYRADVAVRGDRIAAVARRAGPGPSSLRGAVEIDAAGLYLAPGFIDSHSHAGPGLATPELSAAAPLVAQGITTVLVNPDGGGPVELEGQRAALLADGLGVNAGLLVGHGSVRREVLGMADRTATAEELERMRGLVRRAMEAGSFGLSSGLFYAPGSYAPLAEVVELARVAASYGGAYQSHIRDEADYGIGVVAAVEEVIAVAREAELPGVVTHVKVLGPRVWGLADTLVQRIEAARAEGVEVWADQYPYLASATGLSAALVPRWAVAGDSLNARLADPPTRERILEAMVENLERRGGPERIQFRRAAHAPGIEGRTLAAVSAERGEDPREAALSLLEGGYVGIVSFNMTDADVERLMTRPWTMTASDGGLVAMDEGVPHPRSYGTFPRKLRRYVVESPVLEPGDAIRTMTSLPARVYGIRDRGVVREGAFADLVVFDLGAVEDPATFTDPHRLARGMVHVMVNGEWVLRDGALTDARPGRVLRR
jgi:N-acyl-D-amino-acid deacylase